MYQQSILVYAQFRYLKLSLLLVLLAIAAYVWDAPLGPPNGGTWLGYTLGGLATLLIILLMWLGIRKRHYKSKLGTLQGWVSAHIYLGVGLIFISTLHAGFQFGWNIHTLAYILMLLVVASGFYGVFAYLRYPPRISANNAGMNREQMQQEIIELHNECLLLSEQLAPSVRETLSTAIANLRLGGGVWQQLRPDWAGRPLRHSDTPAALQEYEAYDAVMYTVADQLTQETDAQRNEAMRRIIELWGRRNALVKRLQQSIQYQVLMDIWLILHIPLSFALLATLIVHIVTVFLYW
jgi:hypothetical protein